VTFSSVCHTAAGIYRGGMTRALPGIAKDISISRLPRKAPAYMHRVGRGGLYAQFWLKDGKRFGCPLLTRNDEVAKARMVPLLEGLIKAGKLDRSARVCAPYLVGRCAACRRVMPGAV
jgi:hypothetical protein